MRPRSHARQAFTLIEMSIVLLIIGLIVGGIFTGQELYRISQVNSVATDMSRFRVAFDGFKLKYSAIPGDMKNATHYFGSGASCPLGGGTGTQTCNGDGNGRVGFANGPESLRAWQHLAAAGFIPNPATGYYTGVPGPLGFTLSGFGDHRIGTNAPASRIKNVGYALFYINTVLGGAGDPTYFAGLYGNALMVGGQLNGSEPATPAFTPAEAKSLDDKFDDGKPGMGRIVSRVGAASPNCNNATTSNNSATATYTLSYSGKACFLYMMRMTE